MAKLHPISKACDDPQRKADVVFIHGLGGDAFGTWRHGEGDDTSWPHWLAHEFPEVGVWSLGHAADPSKPLGWLARVLGKGGADAGQGMSLQDRAGQVLDRMRLDKRFRGERPIVFVCHSLGGLLAKQILRQAHDNAGNADPESISRRTAAVLFLATPHHGADLATLVDNFSAIFGPTASLMALKAHDPHLRNLYNWYRNHAPKLDIATETYFEGRDVFGFRIVDETSSQPGVGPDAVMLDEDHLSIAKPRERDAQVCQVLEEMLRNVVARSHAQSGADAQPDGMVANPPAAAPVSPHAQPPFAPSSTESPIPRGLQPPGYAFRGRSELLAALVERLQHGRSTAVVGYAGMGKTALVVEALQQVLGRDPGEQQAVLRRSRFADGIVFLDLYLHHGQAEPVWGALATARGEPAKDSAGNEVPALQRAIAACGGKRLLLVVEGGEEARGTTEADGFARTTRVALLDPLPLQQSTVLWLSRRGDQWPSHETLSLEDPLDDDDARALFDELAADPATGAPRVAPPLRDRALALLHGHPLAITWTAALMASGNVVKADLLADLAEQPSLSLHDPQQKAHTLVWLFDRSLRGLNVDARRSLLAAGLLAADAFPRAAIAAATGLDDRAQRTALEACLAARLLRLDENTQVDAGAPDYRFGHALAYGYAREQARADAATAAGLLSGLATWAHDVLKTGLAVQAPIDAAAAVSCTLSHAQALLAADTPPGLWWPLAHALLHSVGDRYEELGQLGKAVEAREAVARWLEKAQAARPQMAKWLRESAACHDRQGGLDLAQGNLAGAQRHYETALGIAERLAAQYSSDAERQRDLSISHSKLGDVQNFLGNLSCAQRHYEDALAISGSLVAQDPANAEWQRDLSIRYSKLGELRQAQGDLPGAQYYHEAALGVFERLAAQDPTDAERQRDLGVSHSKLGEVLQGQGNLSVAQRHYEADLAIIEHLTAQDPVNAGWQRDLSYCHTKLGELRQVLGDLLGAQRHYAVGLAIDECLAAQDPANASWQHDLAMSRIKLAGVCAAGDDVPGAFSHLQAARTILQALCRRAPEHPQFQRHLATLEQWIAALEDGTADPSPP